MRIVNDYMVRKQNSTSYVLSIHALNKHFVINQSVLDFIKYWSKEGNLIQATQHFRDQGLLLKNDIEIFCNGNLFRCLTDTYALKGDKELRSTYLKVKVILFSSNFNLSICKALSFLISQRAFFTSLLLFSAVLGQVYFLNKDILYNVPSIGFFGYYILTMFIHEFGHVTSLYKYSGKSSPIGFGFYIFQPILYSNVSMSWSLEKRERIIISLSGIYFEFILLTIVSFILLSLNISPLNLLIAFSIRSIYNLNPLFRSDGYWVLSDFIELPNLKEASNRQLIDVLLYRKKIKNYRLFAYGIFSYVFIALIAYNLIFNYGVDFFLYLLDLYKELKNNNLYIADFLSNNMLLTFVYSIIIGWIIKKVRATIYKKERTKYNLS